MQFLIWNIKCINIVGKTFLIKKYFLAFNQLLFA